MGNLKDIKRRISSIKNTQKITRAMKMVAAAKVKKAQNQVESSRPFSIELAKVFARLLRNIKVSENSFFEAEGQVGIDNYPVLLKERKLNTAGILVITSSKGLAGAYNANVVRSTLKRVEELNSQGIGVKLFVIGQKGISVLKRESSRYGYEILGIYSGFSNNPTSSFAELIVQDMSKAFIELKIDSIEIITTRFKNMMSYKVSNWKILPLDIESEDLNIEKVVDVVDELMEFEPCESDVLQTVVPMFMSNTIYQALLESNASELASRMTAMSAACNNAEDMIKNLTIEYNKARQAGITQEINEVVSGADALKT